MIVMLLQDDPNSDIITGVSMNSTESITAPEFPSIRPVVCTSAIELQFVPFIMSECSEMFCPENFNIEHVVVAGDGVGVNIVAG